MLDWVGDEAWWDRDLLSVCRPNVIAEHYDDAVRLAFICIEERIRDLAGIHTQDNGYGIRLVDRAFNEKRTDFALRLLRKGVKLESARFFIRGALGLFRNPPAHQLANYDRETCLAILRTANLMLQLIEQGRASIEDLWYTIRHPEEAIAPDVALQGLLFRLGPLAAVRELLLLRAESVDCEEWSVVDLIDANLPAYLMALRRQQRQHWIEIGESLLHMLNDKDVQVQKSVIRYLTFFPDRRTAEALCKILHEAGEQPEELLIAVIDALAILKDPIGRRAIAELLSQAPSPGIRAAAIEALGQMGHTRYVVRALTEVLEGAGWSDMKRAITALREIEAQEAIPVLHRCLAHGKPEIQVEVCQTLGKFAEPESAQLLGELLTSTKAEDVRRAAAKALGEIRTDVALSYLDQCQRDENSKPEDKQDKVLLGIIAEAQRRTYLMEEVK